MSKSQMRESATIEQFIRDRQLILMRRAIATLTTAADEELAFQFHRLSGSLGTYQLHAAASLLRELEMQAEASREVTPDVLRSHALTGLRTITTAMEQAA